MFCNFFKSWFLFLFQFYAKISKYVAEGESRYDLFLQFWIRGRKSMFQRRTKIKTKMRTLSIVIRGKKVQRLACSTKQIVRKNSTEKIKLHYLFIDTKHLTCFFRLGKHLIFRSNSNSNIITHQCTKIIVFAVYFLLGSNDH